MGIAQLLNFFSKPHTTKDTEQEQTSFYRSVYPESVRYAFKYRGAELGKAEMLALIDQFIHETVYLVTKGLAFDRETQRSFLEDMTRLFVQENWQEKDLADLLRRYIHLMPEDVTVTGTKLAQISRSGADKWQDMWYDLIQTLYDESPDALPCLIAHTPIFAFHQFIEIYRQRKNSKLILLMPDWMVDDSEEQMGYQITLGETPTVNIQVKDACLYGGWACLGKECKLKRRFCTDAIFIDDTINTSTTSNKLLSFWLTEYGLNMPRERVRVITDLRNVESARKRTKH